MQRLTKEQAALIGLYTGIVCGPFSDIQELAEKTLGRSIFTYEFADSGLVEELKEAVKSDFKALCYVEEK